MARNKYPQETVDKILNTAMSLFIERGYEHTSIQDIIDQLGGLTKGAIYYHFKSKEDILLAITHRIGQHTEQVMQAVVRDPGLNGLEKLRKMFQLSVDDPKQEAMMAAAPNLLENPHFLAILMQSIVRDVAPNYISPVMEEGMRDGSIQTDCPRELGEMMILLTNLWCNALVWPAEQEVLERRMRLLSRMLKQLGVDLMDEEMIQALQRYTALSQENREERP